MSAARVIFSVHAEDDVSECEGVEQPAKVVAQPVACWREGKGWSKAPAECVKAGMRVYAADGRESVVGGAATSCQLLSGQPVEGFLLDEAITTSDFDLMLTTHAPLIASLKGSVKELEVAELEPPQGFEELRFTPELVAEIKAFYPAKFAKNASACATLLEGKTLRALLAEQTLATVFAARVRVSSGEPQRWMSVYVEESDGCGASFIVARDEEQLWRVVAFNDAHVQHEGWLGWGIYDLPDYAVDVDGDGVAEVRLSSGSDGGRSFNFARLEAGKLHSVGITQTYGD